MSRKATRLVFRNLVVGKLAGLDLVQTDSIKNGRPANFYGALTVVCIYSYGTDWEYVGRRTSTRKFPLVVDIFVKYADEELSWDEADAEDRMDDISDAVLDVVDDNQANESHWSGLSVMERTQTGDTVDVNGTEYRRETIIVLPA